MNEADEKIEEEGVVLEEQQHHASRKLMSYGSVEEE